MKYKASCEIQSGLLNSDKNAERKRPDRKKENCLNFELENEHLSIMSLPMSYYHKPRTNPLDNRTFFQILDHNTLQHPDKEAIVFYNENSNRSCLTFQQLKDQSIKFAAALLKLGFKRGDKILIYAPNSLEFVICWIAVVRIGVCAVFRSPGDVEWQEFDLATKVKCKGLICGLNVTENQRNRLVNEIAEFVEHGAFYAHAQSTVEVIIIIDQGETATTTHAWVHTFDDLMENAGKNSEAAEVKTAQTKVDSDYPLLVFYTSGSTGKLKAATYTHHSIINAFNLTMPGMTAGTTKILLTRYMAWSYGVVSLASALITTKTLVTCDYSKITMQDSFKYLFDIAEKEQCTGFGIPPQHVHELLLQHFHERHDFSSLKTWSFGSQIIHRKTIQSLLEVFPDKKSILVYAATEVLTVAIQPLNQKDITKKEDYGKMYMFPDIEVKVIDDQGHVVPLGSKGEICVRGPKVFHEYLEDPEESAKTKDANRWVHTSDYGIMFDRARIKVLGRKTDLIDSHNQAVFPVEVEEILIEHPDVLDVVAVGVPAGNDGKEDICACVIEVPRSNLKERVKELHKWCEHEYAVANNSLLKPKYIVSLEAFPITRSGKIDRLTIKQIAKKYFKTFNKGTEYALLLA